MAPLDTRYQAAMTLSGVGDSLGYRNGQWLRCTSGLQIYEELKECGGINNLSIKPPEWRVSSCTVLQLHTAIALTTQQYKEVTDSLVTLAAKQYKLPGTRNRWDMVNRDPDEIVMTAPERLNPDTDDGFIAPFDPKGISSAAAARGPSIGLRHPNPEELQDLIKVSIDFGRMSHHHPTGYLGTLATALFTSYALQKKPVQQWGCGLLEALPKALEYVKERKINVEENLSTWNDFEDKWRYYIKLRNIEAGQKDPNFPDQYDVKMRDDFYKSLSSNGYPGSTACDATLIAYDVILSYNGSWEDLCVRSMCHGGMSNITCSIASCWYGAMHGYEGVSKCNYTRVEFCSHLKGLGELLYNHSYHQLVPVTAQSDHRHTEESAVVLSNEEVEYIYVREGMNTDTLIDLQVTEIRKDVVSDEAVSIGEAIYSHIRRFLDELGNAYPSCKVSELLKVGSFHEGTKIDFADEFDFIAVLSEISKPGVLTVECNYTEDNKVNVFFDDSLSDLTWVNPKLEEDEKQEQQAAQLMEKVCTRLYNIVMSDRISVPHIALYSHKDYAEWMPLPTVNGIALSVRFSEARLPNMVWEFLYKDRTISVDITLAVRYGNVEKCFKEEMATVSEIGRAIVERGSILLVAYAEGFRITLTETEVNYVRNRLSSRHKHLYLYLKSFNYRYGEYDLLKVTGYKPFSSYMLKSICIYHDLRCKEDTARNESCLRDIVDIMEQSITEGYLSPAETLSDTIIGYLPSIFNKSTNLYRELHKPVDRFKALRKVMIHDIKTIHFSGRKWSSLDHMLQGINNILMASVKEVCDQIWSDSNELIMLKLK